MPSIVHSDGWRSLSRSSTSVNRRQRRFSHYCRPPSAVNSGRLPSAATAFSPTNNRKPFDTSLGWRCLFLQHDLIQLRGLRIRKILTPLRDEKPASPELQEFVRSQIESIPSLSRPPPPEIRDGSGQLVATIRWPHNCKKLAKLEEDNLATEECSDKEQKWDKEPRIWKVAVAYRRASGTRASRMIHHALEEQSSISAGILLSEETESSELDKQFEEVLLNSTRDLKSPVDGEEDKKAGLVTTTLQAGDSIHQSWSSDAKVKVGFSRARPDTKAPNMSLRTITAKVMNNRMLSKKKEPLKVSSMEHTEHEDEAKLARLSPAEKVYLARSGYTIQDVNFWVDILSEKDIYRAARTIFENVTASNSESADNMTGYNPVPSFVLHSFLGKTQLPVGVLRQLLISVWHHMNRLTREQHTNTQAKFTKFPLAGLTFALFVRLFQRAREVMPASIVNVAAIVSTYLSWSPSQRVLPPSSNTTHDQLARLTTLYNRTLVVLSKPPRLDPMKSSALQERAQFDVLARMIDHRPPIELNREGWRAIIAVLLRRQKTKRERKWAELKSASWPPFKESRIGSDEQLTPNDGISRAHQAIRRMREAGYSTTTWEHVATILSGWDTDCSPTIQSRGFISPMSILSFADVQAARIKATRTLHEAWACFLSQCEEHGKPEALVYMAMFEKIIFDHLRTQPQANKVLHVASSRPTALPGDGIEVSTPPVSPAEAVYLRSQPPSFEAFFDRMLSDGIEPRGRLFALLLNHAPNIITAYKVINSCIKAYNGVIPKLILVPLVSKEEVEAASIPSYVLAAVIRFLCLAKDDANSKGPHILAGDTVIVPDWIMHKAKRTVHAYHLLKRFQPRYRPAWNHVLDSLSGLGLTKYLTLAHHKELCHFNRILAAIMARQVIAHMKTIQLELDAVGFHHLCICMEKAALSARMMTDKGKESLSSKEDVQVESHDEKAQTLRFGQGNNLASPFEEARSLLTSGSQYLRTVFQELVGTASKDASSPLQVPDVPPIPKLLVTPKPVQLHAYVRVLGVLQDHEGILSLAQWMHTHHKELYKSALEELGGHTRLQSVFVAMRVFLEQPSEDGMVQQVGVDLSSANPELVELVAREIRAVHEWGDWPSDELVQTYLWPYIQRTRNVN